MHGVMRSREDWLKGREQHDLREIDLSKDAAGTESTHHLGLIVDFTAGVIGLVYEMPAAEGEAKVAPMHAPPVDWREVNAPPEGGGDFHKAWQERYEAAKAKAAEPPKSETVETP